MVEPFARRVLAAHEAGRVTFAHRHRVDELLTEAGAVVGVRGMRLAPSETPRGEASNRDPAGEFVLRAQAVIVTSGGIGAITIWCGPRGPRASALRRGT